MRAAAWLGLVVGVALLSGCSEPPSVRAFVDPPTGVVPYAARIVCSAPPGTYTYALPDGSAVTTRDAVLDVTVDRLEWAAEVTWTDGRDARTAMASARGTNALPTILQPRLNGDPYLWRLAPRVKTLIDFTHYPAGLSGPESGVLYDGPWHIVDLRVEAEDKVVCGASMGDSIYTPPLQAGVYHALYHGQIWDNACLVYPLLTMETDPSGRPYAPEPLDGYACDRIINRDLLEAVGFPEQYATIRVTVEDEWKRRTTASFDVPVAPIEQQSFYDDFDKDLFYVSSAGSAYYYHRNCPQVCAIPRDARLYFASARNAEAAGKQSTPDCIEP